MFIRSSKKHLARRRQSGGGRNYKATQTPHTYILQQGVAPMDADTRASSVTYESTLSSNIFMYMEYHFLDGKDKLVQRSLSVYV